MRRLPQTQQTHDAAMTRAFFSLFTIHGTPLLLRLLLLLLFCCLGLIAGGALAISPMASTSTNSGTDHVPAATSQSQQRLDFDPDMPIDQLLRHYVPQRYSGSGIGSMSNTDFRGDFVPSKANHQERASPFPLPPFFPTPTTITTIHIIDDD